MNMKKKNDDDYAIKLDQVSKEYILHHEKPTLVEKFFKGKDEKFLALKNINLTINKGENIGIMGDNGSGKTTLLKIIAGITAQTTGTIDVKGNVISLIDLNAGFHDDLSGYQNIYLNGMFIGMTKKEIDRKLKDIVAFAGIRQFIDATFFTYSQGMKLRLGFSVAIHSNPDILLLDENFSVGDAKFGKKSADIIKKFRKQKKTMLIASHWRPFIEQNCERIITLKEGKIISNLFNKTQNL
jgi:ABC-type polysaccharide/polyol phosphate transport system ATPase subunit